VAQENHNLRIFDSIVLIKTSIQLLILLPLNRSHNLPRVLTRPELAVINTLPGARVQASIRDGHAHASPHQTALDVRRHIIQSLSIMPVHIPLLVLGRNAVERVRHVLAHILVVVLVQAEGAGRVLDEEVHEADFVGFELGELAHDFVGYEVAAAGLGGEGEGFLGEGHCWWWWWVGVLGWDVVVVGGWIAGGWWAAGAGWEV
jgi:hypothetical protein